MSLPSPYCANWGNENATTGETKMRQLGKRKCANWGNENAPTEEMWKKI